MAFISADKGTKANREQFFIFEDKANFFQRSKSGKASELKINAHLNDLFQFMHEIYPFACSIIFHALVEMSLDIFSKSTFSKSSFSVKHLRSRSGPTFCGS